MASMITAWMDQLRDRLEGSIVGCTDCQTAASTRQGLAGPLLRVKGT